MAKRIAQFVALMILATVVQAQEIMPETYTAYRITSFSYDRGKQMVIWNMTVREVDADGNTLETIQKEVPYVLDLDTGGVTRSGAAGFVGPYFQMIYGRELQHWIGILARISMSLDDGNPPAKDVRASAR